MTHRFRVCFTRFAVYTYLCCCSLYVHAESNTSHGPSERLHQFLPDGGTILTEGTTVQMTAVVSLTPSSLENAEFMAFLTVNGQRFRRYDTVLTPGAYGREKMYWWVRVSCPRMAVRLQLLGVGKASGTQYSFLDITRRFRVRYSPGECWLCKVIRRLSGCGCAS
jgi:hypothetical protein